MRSDLYQIDADTCLVAAGTPEAIAKGNRGFTAAFLRAVL